MNSDESTGDDSDERRLADWVANLTERIRTGGSEDLPEEAMRLPEDAERLRALLPVIRALAAMAGHGGDETGEETPEQLGDYLPIRVIGRGEMGIVYEAWDVGVGRKMALKVLPRA